MVGALAQGPMLGGFGGLILRVKVGDVKPVCSIDTLEMKLAGNKKVEEKGSCGGGRIRFGLH